MCVEMESKFSSNMHKEDYFCNLDALYNIDGSSSVGDISGS